MSLDFFAFVFIGLFACGFISGLCWTRWRDAADLRRNEQFWQAKRQRVLRRA